ncbi:protein prenylyltransferase [Hesseltinella vesiculosa]|uniref:Geranylgeranyl transferase type-2 subunit alpha n=1 Tax=Hesseltinella vesiculosa TaxID=101127 RepID=A0A1X2GHN4_9FUNG|nr:protein prenylyltransferase [Hesseltinella vesiculosa]
MSDVHGRKREKTTDEIIKARRAKEASKIQEYNDLVLCLRKKMDEQQYDQDAFNFSTKILRWNPDYYSVWNHRRIVIQDGLLKPTRAPDEHDVTAAQEMAQKLFLQELDFFMQLIRINPKSYWLWNHRLWCLRTMPKPSWAGELHLVNKMLTLDARNFHGWTYRRVVVHHLRQSTASAEEDDSLVNQEFDFTTQKINQSFSNYSAWHQRSKLLPEIVKDMTAEEKNDVARNELEMVQNAIYTDPDDQSAWLYYWWVLGKAPSHVMLLGVYHVGDGNIVCVFNDMVRFSQYPTLLDDLQNPTAGQWFPMETVVSTSSSYFPGDSGSVWLFVCDADQTTLPSTAIMDSSTVFPISSAMTMDSDKTWTEDIQPVTFGSNAWTAMVEQKKALSKPVTLAKQYKDSITQESNNWYTLDPVETLKSEIQVVRDLIDCEPESKWALQTLVHFLQQLRLRTGNEDDALDDECLHLIDQLIALDPYRVRRYEEIKNRIHIRRKVDAIRRNKDHASTLINYLFEL